MRNFLDKLHLIHILPFVFLGFAIAFAIKIWDVQQEQKVSNVLQTVNFFELARLPTYPGDRHPVLLAKMGFGNNVSMLEELKQSNGKHANRVSRQVDMSLWAGKLIAHRMIEWRYCSDTGEFGFDQQWFFAPIRFREWAKQLKPTNPPRYVSS